MWKQRRILDNILWGKLSRVSQDIFSDFDVPTDDRVVDICREARVTYGEGATFEAMKHFALINRLFIDIYYHGRNEPRVVEAIHGFVDSYQGVPISAPYKFILWDSEVNPWILSSNDDDEEDNSTSLGEMNLTITLQDKQINCDFNYDEVMKDIFVNYQQGQFTCNAIYLRDLFYHIKNNGKFCFYSE